MGLLDIFGDSSQATGEFNSEQNALNQAGGLINTGIGQTSGAQAQLAQILSALMGGMGTSGTGATGATPSWANVQLTNAPNPNQPFTPQEIATLQQAGALNVGQTASQLGQAQQSNLGQRGLADSSAANQANQGLQLYKDQQLAANNANITQEGIQLGNQYRQENNQNALNQGQYNAGMFSQLYGMNQQANPYISALQSLGGAYGNLGGQYADMAGTTGTNLGSLLGMLGGAYIKATM